MANSLQSFKYTKSATASISSGQSSYEESEESLSTSSLQNETSVENAVVKKRAKKMKKNKRTKSSKNLSGTENILRGLIGHSIPVKSSSEKKKNISKSRLKSIEDTSNKKKRASKFRFPKSKSSQSGPFSKIKSRYLNVFKKATSTEQSKTKVN